MLRGSQVTCDKLMHVGIMDPAHLAIANAEGRLFANAVSSVTALLSDSGSEVLSEYLTGEMVDDLLLVMKNHMTTGVCGCLLRC